MTHLSGTDQSSFPQSLERGKETIQAYVKTLAEKPGVYRMLNSRSEVLYIGKAKSLKNRVTSYTQLHNLPNRLQRMVAETSSMEFITTETEVEALLLEANLIKRLQPRYNILLKDAKFFSYLLLTDHEWPRLMKFRGEKTEKGRYFGPFASTEAVHHTLNTLHKIFRLRSCTDSFFATRKRPCLQYHIKRCTAPCVSYISHEDYQESVRHVVDFLEGKSQRIQQTLSEKMLEASERRDYEKAAVYRNQIQALTAIQVQQSFNMEDLQQTDVIAIGRMGGKTCFQVFFYRSGSPYGNHSFFPDHLEEMTLEEAFEAFLELFYEDNFPPREILVNRHLENKDLLEKAFSRKSGVSVQISLPVRGFRKKIVGQAEQNALEALSRNLQSTRSRKKIFAQLQKAFALPSLPQRIEIYDNSHIQGKYPVGSMVVAGMDGFQKQAYRKFAIKTGEGAVTPGDDYGMMRDVLKRRFSGSLAKDAQRNPMPDLLLVDGGPGQLSATLSVLDQLRLSIPVVAIAKGPDRDAGDETFYMQGKTPFKLHEEKDLLFYLQQLRDEAHRFAIGAHRMTRSKGTFKSVLDDLPGIGPKRKRALLNHFGSPKAIEGANIQELSKVDGISRNLAKVIYRYFHP